MNDHPIRVLVIDDEPAARGAIVSLLEGDPDVAVVGACADGRSALTAIAGEAPDLLFLDVQMPEMDGFTMLQQLDPATLPTVVFVTAWDQYALRAFDVHAVDYLLKPFDDERFRQALGRAKTQVKQGRLGALSLKVLSLLDGVARLRGEVGAPAPRYPARMAIKSGGRVTVLAVEDIDWIGADRDYVRLHAGKVAHVLRETMKDIESQFDPARFVRIHRSTIVNVERIKELQPYFRGEYVVILRDGTSLKLSRGYKERLEEALGRSF